jgi:hypothetical protein
MYLWCSVCCKAAESSQWNEDKFKYGVCPSCGKSAYRNAVSWEAFYEVNGYGPIPTYDKIYYLGPTLF